MLIANFLLFQLAWFACVAGAAQGLPWLGVAVTLATVTWHLSAARNRKPELILIVAAIFLGACFDQTMLAAEWVNYQHHGWTETLVPAWILALWAAFASTLNVSLAWMQGRYLVATLFGAAGGPLAYLGAEKLGAVTLNGQVAYTALSVGWAVMTPALLYMTKHLNGFKRESQA